MPPSGQAALEVPSSHTIMECNEVVWKAMEMRRFLEVSRDWQAVHDFFAGVAAGTTLLDSPGLQLASLPDLPAAAHFQRGHGTQDNGRRRTYRLDIAYLGSRFEGFAKDHNLRTVCGSVEDALRPLNPSGEVHINAAGRTDRGVHAASQVLSFTTYDCPAPADIASAVDAIEPRGGLTCLAVLTVPRSFHATFSVLWRQYLYLFPLRSASAAPGSISPCVWHAKSHTLQVPELSHMDAIDVDPAIVDGLLARLRGEERDFSAFARKTPEGKDCTCRVVHTSAFRAVLPPTLDRPDGTPVMAVELVGNRFLRRMVRVLVATAIREAVTPALCKREEVEGNGGGQPDMDALLHIAESGDRLRSCLSLPAPGLCFARALYPPELDLPPPQHPVARGTEPPPYSRPRGACEADVAPRAMGLPSHSTQFINTGAATNKG
mmetsp:Transcript_33577/g.94998  ORF Transcript_33577/g.94998 Transcript_33577/m.94998 type:complete len:434 (-) Transcript_33577:38-1339(-)